MTSPTSRFGEVCQDGLACKKPGECKARGKCAVFGDAPPFHRQARDELARSKRHGPDSRTIDALEYALQKLAAAERDFIQAHRKLSALSESGFTKEDAAKLVERKAKALTNEYCRGDSGPGGYVWINKEAEWQVILLEELAEEMRNAKGI